jgi:hypothetical protein
MGRCAPPQLLPRRWTSMGFLHRPCPQSQEYEDLREGSASPSPSSRSPLRDWTPWDRRWRWEGCCGWEVAGGAQTPRATRWASSLCSLVADQGWRPSLLHSSSCARSLQFHPSAHRASCAKWRRGRARRHVLRRRRTWRGQWQGSAADTPRGRGEHHPPLVHGGRRHRRGPRCCDLERQVPQV